MIMRVSGKTKLYGILGNPVSHSLSPVMHNAAFAEKKIDAVYVPFATTDLKMAVDGIRGLCVKGASVTIPYKEEVAVYLDDVAPVAKKIGAVNTIICEGDKLVGINTDWRGACRALEDKIVLSQKKVVLLGAGGAARAIGFGMKEKDVELCLVSRTESRGKKLADELDCPWVSLTDVVKQHGDILINATSIGMVPDIGKSPVPDSVLPRFQVVMDIVYAPMKTHLLTAAEQAGCEIINGLEMLLYQGVAQFEMWTGAKAPVETMRQALLKALQK